MSHTSPKPDQQTSAETILLTALNDLATSASNEAIQKTGIASFANVVLMTAAGNDPIIIGDGNDGSWRFTLSGSNILLQNKQTGNWVTINTWTP